MKKSPIWYSTLDYGVHKGEDKRFWIKGEASIQNKRIPFAYFDVDDFLESVNDISKNHIVDLLKGLKSFRERTHLKINTRSKDVVKSGASIKIKF